MNPPARKSPATRHPDTSDQAPRYNISCLSIHALIPCHSMLSFHFVIPGCDTTTHMNSSCSTPVHAMTVRCIPGYCITGMFHAMVLQFHVAPCCHAMDVILQGQLRTRTVMCGTGTPRDAARPEIPIACCSSQYCASCTIHPG